MAIIKWQTNRYDSKIERMECTRETARTVWYMASGGIRGQIERKQSKDGDWHQLHDSWDAAHVFLMGRAQRSLESARIQLASAQGEFGNVKGMKKPEKLDDCYVRSEA